MSRRQRIDTVKGAKEIMSGALNLPEPPEYLSLSEKELRHWDAIVKTRATRSWTPADFEHAAELCKIRADMDRIREQLREEGETIVSPSGELKVHPLRKILDTLTGQTVTLSRILQIHALATQGQSAHQAKTNLAHNEAMQLTEEQSTDDLIARPRH